MVKIFDVSSLKGRPTDGSFDMEAYERSVQENLVPNHGKLPFMNEMEVAEAENGNSDMGEEEKKEAAGGSDDWSDADSDDDSDDSDDSDMSDDGKHKKKNKKLNPRKNTVGLSKKMLEKEKRKDFFKNL